LANSDGQIKIGKNNNNLMPTLLVLQFMYMIFGIFLSLLVYHKPKEKQNEKEKIFIVRANLTLRSTKNELIKCWGIPSSQKIIGDTINLTYKNTESITSFKIYKDTIIESNERKLNNK
jgi:predicted histidine transporter YuiF (NhaC family)